MEKFPYWLTQNIKSTTKLNKGTELQIFTNSEVMEGRSPLNEFGERIINDFLINTMSPFNQIWIFPKSPIDHEVAFNVGIMFRLIEKIKSDISLTKSGIYINDDGITHLTAPQPVNYDDPTTMREFNIEEAEKSFELSKFISSSPKFSQYFSQFEYLKKLRCTDPFLGYLGLWSFIEIEWSNSNRKTDIKVSLKNLLEESFKENRKAKRDFNIRLKAISSKVGEAFGEHNIRNLLAHGKYHYAKVKWESEDNKNFHGIHDELFLIMFRALEKRILNPY